MGNRINLYELINPHLLKTCINTLKWTRNSTTSIQRVYKKWMYGENLLYRHKHTHKVYMNGQLQ